MTNKNLQIIEENKQLFFGVLLNIMELATTNTTAIEEVAKLVNPIAKKGLKREFIIFAEEMLLIKN